MDVFMHNIPWGASASELTDHCASILHAPPFTTHFPGPPINFKLVLHRGKKRGLPHGGTGIMTLPQREIWVVWQRLSLSSGIPPIQGRYIKWKESQYPARSELIDDLRRTPYQPPHLVREREQLENALSRTIPATALQFGWFDRDDVFSIEWEHPTNELIELKFIAESREIRVSAKNDGGGLGTAFARFSWVVIKFRNIQTISHSGRPSHSDRTQSSIIFSFYNTPSFESMSIFHSAELKRDRDLSMGYEDHREVVGFVSLGMRLVLPSYDDLRAILDMIKAAKLRSPSILVAEPERREHFSKSNRDAFNAWVKTLDWSVAFQCTALVQNLKISAGEFSSQIRRLVDAVIHEHGAHIVAETLRMFSMRLDSDWPRIRPGPRAKDRIDSIIHHRFTLAVEDAVTAIRPDVTRLTDDLFQCRHVTITPTTMHLEGPFPDQANRVLREYPNHQDSFLRVSFTDEERLQLRWEREVDGLSFVRRRVGHTLKHPLVIAGRSFYFLAYSFSALREHAVWFVTPFYHPEHGHVTAESIRAGLGNFDSVIRYPALYGARMSQAFSATEPSVAITADEILPIPDLKSDTGAIYTDGIGTISRYTANKIGEVLAQRRAGKRRKHPRDAVVHSAFQVRFGGYKGMLSVDYKQPDNSVYARPSMNKFLGGQSLNIEIANTFERPGRMYLNRPLIMILETLGVPISVFTNLQAKVRDEVQQSVVTLSGSAKLLETYGLGAAFRLPSIFNSLQKLGLKHPPVDDSFMKQGMTYAVNDVLRELKHRARIPVEDAYTLVGVADVHKYLQEGEIFVCIKETGKRAFYLTGRVMITRSPAIHPGDVQMVTAIGSPPADSPFVHEEFPNCCVFACQGERSLPQSLGGGDLDGDLYNLIPLPDFFIQPDTPGSYPPTPRKELPEGQRCTIDDVAEHIVDYINNDHLGLIATQNLKIADQSPLMSRDPDCLKLAAMASQAVDFAKFGIPANVDELPKLHSRLSPDWSAGEIVGNASGEFYRSTRALGELYRAIDLPDITTVRRAMIEQGEDNDDESLLVALRALTADTASNDRYIRDPVSRIIRPEIAQHISIAFNTAMADTEILPQFRSFSAELQYIAAQNSLSAKQALSEEECWAGTIVAKSSQPRRRRDAQAKMREQCAMLVNYARAELVVTNEPQELDSDGATDLEVTLLRGWTAWRMSRSLVHEETFGAQSYGYVALGCIFETLKEIDERDKYV